MVKDPLREFKSRSQLKREYSELKDLVTQLAILTPGQLRRMPLSERTTEALLAAKGMTRTALKRQLGYLQALMAEEEDLEGVRAALNNERQPHVDEVAILHEAERWRDRLLSGGEEEITAVVSRYPEADRVHMRQLARNAKKERTQEKPPRSARLLLRYLRTLPEKEES
jgi:ribosome-associated protein